MRHRLELEASFARKVAELEGSFRGVEAALVGKATTEWRFDAGDGDPLMLRAVPLLDGPRNPTVLEPGEVFAVVQEKPGDDGVLFLQLADGRGWAFDHKPGF